MRPKGFYFFPPVFDVFTSLTPVTFKIFCWIAGNTRLNTNTIILNSDTKIKCAIATATNIHTVNNAVPRLVKSGFLIKIGSPRSGTYVANPEYVWFGDIKNRKQALNMLSRSKTTV